MTFFSYRLVTTGTLTLSAFQLRLSSFLCKFSLPPKKNIIRLSPPLDSVTRGCPPPPPVTPLLGGLEERLSSPGGFGRNPASKLNLGHLGGWNVLMTSSILVHVHEIIIRPRRKYTPRHRLLHCSSCVSTFIRARNQAFRWTKWKNGDRFLWVFTTDIVSPRMLEPGITHRVGACAAKEAVATRNVSEKNIKGKLPDSVHPLSPFLPEMNPAWIVPLCSAVTKADHMMCSAGLRWVWEGEFSPLRVKNITTRPKKWNNIRYARPSYRWHVSGSISISMCTKFQRIRAIRC